MSRSTAHFDAASPSYGHFRHPTGHRRAEFSSPKRPKTVINRDFPGLRAFLAKFVRGLNGNDEIPDSMSRSTARFDAASPSHGHFRCPTGHAPGRVFKLKTVQNGNKSRFPRATCIFGKIYSLTKLKSIKIPDSMRRSTARLDAASPSYGQFRRPVRNGNKSRFPRATCTFGKICPRAKSKSMKFRIQRAEVLRVLTRLARVMAILDAPRATAGRSFQAKNGPKRQ